MKYLQTFNERKFYTIKYDNQELSIDDINNGEWSLTDHLNPKIDKLIMALGDMKARVNTHGSKVYKDEAKKIDLMSQILDSDVAESAPIEATETTVDINIALVDEVEPIEDVSVEVDNTPMNIGGAIDRLMST
jgi:hypothetical protein